MAKKFLGLKLKGLEWNYNLNSDLNDSNNFSNIDGLCLECKEGIFNPICGKCLANEIISWIEELKKEKFSNATIALLRKKILQEIKGILKIKVVSERCMKCGGIVVMCPYCFTERIYNVIKELKIDEKEKCLLRESFLSAFNFDFDRTGYSKEINWGC
jgi:hypothetical protein